MFLSWFFYKADLRQILLLASSHQGPGGEPKTHCKTAATEHRPLHIPGPGTCRSRNVCLQWGDLGWPRMVRDLKELLQRITHPVGKLADCWRDKEWEGRWDAATYTLTLSLFRLILNRFQRVVDVLKTVWFELWQQIMDGLLCVSTSPLYSKKCLFKGAFLRCCSQVWKVYKVCEQSCRLHIVAMIYFRKLNSFTYVRRCVYIYLMFILTLQALYARWSRPFNGCYRYFLLFWFKERYFWLMQNNTHVYIFVWRSSLCSTAHGCHSGPFMFFYLSTL